MEAWRRELYLQHHGILGMRWGKRNGPPYPLGASNHSVSEKKAGWRKSLDSGGKSVDSKSKKGGNNCAYCAVAGFLRTLGYDVTAKSTGGKMQNTAGVLEDCFRSVKVYEGSARAFGKSPEDAERVLKKRFGDNASGAVGVQWIGGNGHTFSWTIKDGVVKFLDFQNNLTDESIRKTFWRMINTDDYMTFARLDGLEINLDNIDKYVNGR